LFKTNALQEALLMLTNPYDAFRGQSRSPNMLPVQHSYDYEYTLIITSTVLQVTSELVTR